MSKKLPRYIVCQNPKCQAVKEVRCPSAQRRVQYCSRRCQALMRGNLTREAARRGGLVSAQRRRRQALARIDHLTKLDIARRFYSIGWKAGVRRERRRAQGVTV